MRAAAATLLALLCCVPARAAGARLLVLDAGNQAILSLRIRRASTGTWSADLLGFARVIDVGQGKDVEAPLVPGACFYDVRATYQDGTRQTRTNLDLCRIHHVTFAP